MRNTDRKGNGKSQAGSDKQKPQRNWGQSQAEYLAALKGQEVVVAFTDGKALKGRLTGVDTYEIFVKQASGLEMMVGKGAIRYLHPASVD